MDVTTKSMPLLFQGLNWLAFLVVFVLLLFLSYVSVRVYQKRSDRDGLVTFVTSFSIACFLATLCLIPIDVAIISSTSDRKTGLKQDWATDDVIDQIKFILTIVYYVLYSVDLLLFLIILPFAYFWFEEDDQDTTTRERLRRAVKYSSGFFVVAVVLLVTGFLYPYTRPDNPDGDLKRILRHSSVEKVVNFLLAVLMVVGSFLYILYSCPGIALLPARLIWARPALPNLSPPAARRRQQHRYVPSYDATLGSSDERLSLDVNRENQRMIESRYEGQEGPWNPRDRRIYERLQREERTLARKVRLEDDSGETSTRFSWIKRISTPIKRTLGIFVLLFTLVGIVSISFSILAKFKLSKCGRKCGYYVSLNQYVSFKNIIDLLLVQVSRWFPVDYIIFIIFVLWIIVACIVGLEQFGIRALCISLFRIKKGGTVPQALIFATGILMLCLLAINYSLASVVIPQYAHFGSQRFCNSTVGGFGEIRDCTGKPEYIIPCTQDNDVCTTTIFATIVDRVCVLYPLFGTVLLYLQVGYVAIALLCVLWYNTFGEKLLRDRRDEQELEDEEDEEDEPLLRNSRARLSTNWDNLQARS